MLTPAGYQSCAASESQLQAKFWIISDSISVCNKSPRSTQPSIPPG